MIPQLVPVLSGGFSLDAFMASQSAGFWIKGTDPATLFQGTDESTPVTAFGDVVGRANDQRVGAGSPISTTQSTTSFKPKYQSTGLAFDGTDDNLLTNYTAGSGANFLIAKVVVPASLSGTQVVLGSWFVGVSTDAVYLGVATNGQVRRGVGSAATSVGPDLRGSTAVIGLTWNGSEVRTFAGSSLVESVAQVGSVNTTTPLRLGALNGAGTGSNYFAGSSPHMLAGREFIDLARFQQIANALGA